MHILELFGGIRAPYKALINLNLEPKTIDYVENDPKIVAIANSMFNTNYQPKSVIGYHYQGNTPVDLLIGGSPCQDFSIAGCNAGGTEKSNTRSSLIWEQLRILKEVMPKYYIWENVKNVLSKKHINVFNQHNDFVKSLGYQIYYEVLNAKDFGVPQNRERVFVLAIRNDINQEFNFDNLEKSKMKPLSNFLEKNVDKSYFIKVNSYVENHFNKNKQNKEYWGKTKLINNDNQVINTLTTNQQRNINSGLILEKTNKHLKIKLYTFDNANNFCFQDSKYIRTITTNTSPSGTTEKLLIEHKYNELLTINWNNKLWNIRTLTELECFRLMGFNDSDFMKAEKIGSKNLLYKVAGNSIVVNVLEAIFKELFKI